MTDIEIYKGDTVQIEITLTNNGEPFITTDENILFSVGEVIGKPPLFTIPVIDGVADITHDITKKMKIGNYIYDVRVYTSDKTLVATPCIGNFRIKGVVNNEI